jgi:hypothetical protein
VTEDATPESSRRVSARGMKDFEGPRESIPANDRLDGGSDGVRPWVAQKTPDDPIAVIVPDESPILTPGAARALLALLTYLDTHTGGSSGQ